MAKAKLKKVSRRRREKKLVERGIVHIKSSFNNTIVTITDTQVAICEEGFAFDYRG